MNLIVDIKFSFLLCIPRVSGDEPGRTRNEMLLSAYSPRERG